MSSLAVILNNQPKMASAVIILEAECYKPWAGKKVQDSVEINKALLHQSRFVFDYSRGSLNFNNILLKHGEFDIGLHFEFKN